MFCSNNGIFTKLSYYTCNTDEDISPLSKVGHLMDMNMRATPTEVEGIDYPHINHTHSLLADQCYPNKSYLTPW